MPVKKKLKSADIGVIDIGSNSVRLVIYRRVDGAFEPVYEKKATCALARSMRHDRPKLDRKGMVLTLKTLRKFRRILQKRNVIDVRAIGTAAMRAVIHTKAGKNFHRQTKRALGHDITIISGRLEARLTAYGVMSGLPKAVGICGDLGGGSLELASIKRGRVGHTVTMALGSLTIINESGHDPLKAEALMHEKLNHVGWVRRAKPKTFYPIGGSWRAVGRIMMKMHHNPPRRIQGFTIRASLALKYARIIERKKPSAFRKMPRKIRIRADVIPYAAAVMAEIISRMKPARITFSAHGVREGLLKTKIR